MNPTDTRPLADTPNADVLEQESTSLEHREAAAQITIPELVLRESDPESKMEKVIRLTETVRRASLRSVHATDCVLYKREDGTVTVYIQDSGCERYAMYWGIRQFDLQKPERIQNSNDPEDFSIRIVGSAYSRLTGGVVEMVEGVRHSKEDFCKGKTGAELEKDVSRAARANLDGTHVRTLSGTSSVPAEELIEAWKGTGKSIDQCAKGRGFGTRDQRIGAVESPDAGISAPPCPVCGQVMTLRKSSRGYFYSCPQWKAHGKDARTIDFEDWKKQNAKKPDPVETNVPAPEKVKPLDADEIFK